MTHATGNPVWKDYPDKSTLVGATQLNRTETALDNLHTSEYGGTSRTRNALFRAFLNGTLSVNGDLYITTGWTVDIDTDSGWTVPGGATPSYYTIPYNNRFWDLSISYATSATPAAGAMSAKIMLNTAAVTTNSIASDSRSTNTWEGNCYCFRPCVPLIAGDKIYFAMWTSTALTVAPTFGWVYPTIMVQDAGPV
jgi:hypothetical protein